MTRPKLYDRVRVLTSSLASEGGPKGTIGYVVDEYPDGAYEVEVSGPDGATIAQFVAQGKDLEVAE